MPSFFIKMLRWTVEANLLRIEDGAVRTMSKTVYSEGETLMLCAVQARAALLFGERRCQHWCSVEELDWHHQRTISLGVTLTRETRKSWFHPWHVIMHNESITESVHHSKECDQRAQHRQVSGDAGKARSLPAIAQYIHSLAPCQVWTPSSLTTFTVTCLDLIDLHPRHERHLNQDHHNAYGGSLLAGPARCDPPYALRWFLSGLR